MLSLIGTILNRAAPLASKVTVTIGGQPVTVGFAGLTGTDWFSSTSRCPQACRTAILTIHD